LETYAELAPVRMARRRRSTGDRRGWRRRAALVGRPVRDVSILSAGGRSHAARGRVRFVARAFRVAAQWQRRAACLLLLFHYAHRYCTSRCARATARAARSLFALLRQAGRSGRRCALAHAFDRGAPIAPYWRRQHTLRRAFARMRMPLYTLHAALRAAPAKRWFRLALFSGDVFFCLRHTHTYTRQGTSDGREKGGMPHYVFGGDRITSVSIFARRTPLWLVVLCL